MPKSTNSKTLGKLLRERREQQGLTIAEVVAATKMRAEFVEALENSDYSIFASEVYAKGFLRNYAQLLGLDVNKVYAVYRRETGKQENTRKPIDEELERLPQNEKVRRKVESTIDGYLAQLLTRRGLTAVVVGMISILALFYIITQINALLAPPMLEITSPVEVTAEYEGEVKLAATSFVISGRASPQSLVRMNADPLALRAGNEFVSPEIPVGIDKTVVVITATNQFGKTSTIKLEVSRSGVSVATDKKLDVLIKVQTEVTPLLVRTDGVIKFNDRAFPGDVIDIDAEKRLQIETELPQNVLLTINGKDFTLTKNDQSWELVDGEVVLR